MTGPFELVIMNPPYGKLSTSHRYRAALRQTCTDVPNVYAAFWALGLHATVRGGQVVAIVPRSFANGTYFAGFRHWLLSHLAIDRLHVFESRSTVFADTGVLQENVIVSGTAGARGREVTLSTSAGHQDEVDSQEVPYTTVVHPNDRNEFIRITTEAVTLPAAARYTLGELRLAVSTGRVVDFRSRGYLTAANEAGAVPLVYPGNVRGGSVDWPREIRKPQGFLASDAAAQKMLVPAGVYPLVKRFSAKEERRRVVCGVWAGAEEVAFENHLNYIHRDGRGLSSQLARGVCLWLNSTVIDNYFRTFSGHTQVNAGDLRTLPFPSLDTLEWLGQQAPANLPEQGVLDALVASVLAAEVVPA